MVKQNLITVLLFVIFFPGLATAKELNAEKDQADNRPNIILIMTDDMGQECLGCYGALDYKTPVLDKLASKGIKFNHCYSQPLCTPSRVKIMTGRYNFRNYERFGLLPTSEITFGKQMQDAGYATCMTGKWQLGGDYNTPYGFGFDEYCLQNAIKPAEDFERSTRGHERFWGYPVIVANGKLYESKEQYGPDMLNEYAVNFIKKKKDKPFFLYYPMILTHSPFTPTPNSKDGDKSGAKISEVKYFKDMVEYTDVLVGNVIKALEESGQRENTVLMFTGDNGTTYPVWVTQSNEDMKRVVSTKGRMDKEIRLPGEKTPVTHPVKKWQEGPITRTDHGDIPGGKDLMSQTGTLVPLVIDWPKYKDAYKAFGNECNDLIDFSDFFTTIIDLGKGELPKDRAIDGESFANRLQGKGTHKREYIFCHYWGFGRNKKQARDAIHDGNFKLYNNGAFFYIKEDGDELYPLKENELQKEAKKARKKLVKYYKEVRGMSIPNNFTENF